MDHSHLGQRTQEVLRLDSRVVGQQQFQRVAVRALTLRQVLEPAAALRRRHVERLIEQRRDRGPVSRVDLHHCTAAPDLATPCGSQMCRTSAMHFERFGQADADIAETRSVPRAGRST